MHFGGFERSFVYRRARRQGEKKNVASYPIAKSKRQKLAADS